MTKDARRRALFKAENDELRRSDSLLHGRVTYEMLRDAWWRPESGDCLSRWTPTTLRSPGHRRDIEARGNHDSRHR